MNRLLRLGEVPQVVYPDMHGPAEWPNRAGEPMEAYPKIVRSEGSHTWRAGTRKTHGAHISKSIGQRLDYVSHGLGVTMLRGNLALPSPIQLKRAVGLPADWTPWSALVCDGGASLGVAELTDPPEERATRVGDIFDPNLEEYELYNRIRSTEDWLMGKAKRKADAVEGADQLARARGQEGKPRHRKLHPQGYSGAVPVPPHAGGQQRLHAITTCNGPEQRALQRDDEADGWGPDEAELFSLPIKPFPAVAAAAMVKQLERVKPPPTVMPEEMEAGSPTDNKARNHLRRALRIIEMMKRGERPSECDLTDADFAEFLNKNVKDMLRHAWYDAAQVEQLTSADELPYVSLGNHPSMEDLELAGFAREEIRELAETGRIKEWHWLDGKPPFASCRWGS
eukprot:jgi/Tetstr1/440633/TSEL_028943.t1